MRNDDRLVDCYIVMGGIVNSDHDDDVIAERSRGQLMDGTALKEVSSAKRS